MNTNTNELTNCMNCGCTDEELFTVMVDGEEKTLCADCLYEMGWERCGDCGKWTENIISINDGENYVCESCADDYCRCDECGEYYTQDHVYADDYGNVVCHDCYDRQGYSTCADCGRLIDEYNGNFCEDDEEYYCDDCYRDHQHSTGVEDYSYKPSPEFHARTSEHEERKLFIGVELEVDDGDDAGDLCRDLRGLDQPIYMKHDGSLGGEGVEIVTHPCTLNYHQYELKWGAIIHACESNGYKSHNTTTCGLHTHVNRDVFGDDEYSRRAGCAKLVLLVNALWDKLVTFSRRKPDALENWSARPYLREWDDITIGEFDGNDDDLIEMAYATEDRGRYQAINLTNYATVEFRMFRGTLKRSTLMATLQLVSNMTRYAAAHTPTECVHATWADVLGVEQYKELTAYCTERGLQTA